MPKHPKDGLIRPVVVQIEPHVQFGAYPIKRTVNEPVNINAIVIVDGHESLRCQIVYKHKNDKKWEKSDLTPTHNDRWLGQFTVTKQGQYFYSVEAWIDRFKTWKNGFLKKIEASQDVLLEIKEGTTLVEKSFSFASKLEQKNFSKNLKLLKNKSVPSTEKIEFLLSPMLDEFIHSHPDQTGLTRFSHDLIVSVERERARFSSWYEFFPRSYSKNPYQHGTFKDCIPHLSYVAKMNFDVIYLPPIHPIGQSFKKGPNNTLSCDKNDPGSPWAIGSSEGGHKSIHPQLGTLTEFKSFIKEAHQLGLEISIDIAFQCSPDHPYVKEHPNWFKIRPDGSIQYAENPPKKYQDVYPFDFESEDWENLWLELKSIFVYWIENGVKIFRVDNPHTKSFKFWEWVIPELKKIDPDTLFLAEAFTRPETMYHLAKIGFSQSYTYYTWKNSKSELIDYLHELMHTPVKEFYRPNFWPNTPDILHESLQKGGRPAFVTRLLLAATLTSNYGIYGPTYELCIGLPLKEGSEEYLNSEKYQIQNWDLDQSHSLFDLIGKINTIRKNNTCLQYNHHLFSHHTDNDSILAFSKRTDGKSNVILVIANLDPFQTQSSFVYLNMEELGLNWHDHFEVYDLITEKSYLWHGSKNYVELNPQVLPVHVFQIRK